MTTSKDVRVDEVERIVSEGQPYWLRVDDPAGADLTGCAITAVLWRSWNERTTQEDGEVLTIRRDDTEAEGYFFVGSEEFVRGGVAFLAIAPDPVSPPTARAALRFTVRAGGGKQ